MKQRFSSLDVKVIAHELQESLVSLRLANVYDLSSKILLLKFAKPDVKKQMLIDSGFRCHLTDFARTTAAAPSAFVARLRKFLKTRRLTAVSQIGTDRIIEFQFSDGQYRLFLEFFASGNVILTDADLKILTLLRNVPEGEAQEPQRIGLNYSLENRQNYSGVPPLTKERLRDALQTTIDRAAKVAAGKKKSKPGDELRKGLAVTINELPPMLLEHAFQTTNFSTTVTASEVLADDSLLDQLLNTLGEASKVVKEVTSAEKTTGYIIAKYRTEPTADTPRDVESKREDLLYEDFHPFLPAKFADNPQVKVLTYNNFNKTADEFFSSLEGQKLESRLTEREAAAQRKIEAARQDHAKRIEGLQEAQSLNEQKASAIEANVERVQEAMDAVNGLLEQGMDWVNINKLIEREQKKGNPVAEIIKLPLNLADNIITLLLGSEDVEIEDEAYETGSDESDDEDAAAGAAKKAADSRLVVDINLNQSPWSNARDYYDQKRTAAVKEQKTSAQSSMALKNAEQKITIDLKKGLKQEKAILQPIRTQMWFEKFIWFISSDGYLVLGGKDLQQSETLYKRYLRKGDIYVHADMPGAASVIIKNRPEMPDAPIPPATLAQGGMLSVCSSNAWDSKAGMGAWWVNADQVSKSAPTGEYLSAGLFNVRGTKNFLAPAPLLLGLGIMFKISEESKGKHVKHRLRDGESVPGGDASAPTPFEGTQEDENASDEDDDQGDNGPRANPLQGAQEQDEEEAASDGEQPAEASLEQEVRDLSIAEEQPGSASPSAEEPVDEATEAGDTDTIADTATEAGARPGSAAAWSSRASTAGNEKKPASKRGQRSKAKKIAAKYKDQDEDDRLAAEAVIGAARGREKAEAEAQAKAKREAEIAAQKERRRIALEREQKKTAAHEEARRQLHEEGIELDADETEKATSLDSLVGIPLVGDEIVEAIPVCAPWNALGKFKYKVKFQPGSVKKGKAVKECLEMWKAAAGKKGVIDERATDTERMWPREAELIKALKPEEVINSVPVTKVRLMLAGGLSGGSGGGKNAQGKGKGGARGQKKK
ncbi:hypothetical protein B0T11DRAFT_340547 [Plectosphaerella cucumerina]|uniref:Ribosome quality control complex subunit 2 n=1 Tax=Plectosphaerella cucumerina TaxID=40658 RepID=A0A8K0TAW0_9PEZI|nr:hypothetical protein B0T11DRAFT_340547 [Plectosphaerella cucumerina]